MRLGIFGGSFSPVHFGHLLLAEYAREQLSLNEVWFVPAATPPHKLDQALASDADRVAMLQMAIAGNEAFTVCPLELERGGVSYTVDTLKQIKELLPDAELFLLIGGDSLAEFPTWRNPAEICQLAAPAVMRRPGSPEPDWSVLAPYCSAERLASFAGNLVDVPGIGLSSTEIRRRCAAGETIRYQTPRAVEMYIETKRLFGHPGVR
ncbi:nicotinate-nucleotide adenylyltransferase [Blastopirellula sp. JC732]|uniref:Probable nicotinate-nucleotide adenylyltransferase n=1 Tax=Blastopirellula sediminis TaxID=2894196 RepID=A0A9X1MT05_9BACT|nr:nicotinate-nucleotide adenylyltransferase [Blastopirellula sediminis]MCC9604836.1 nicotinate-nucleotide adenylyltransferase [Blastopirellula sediminis]MCC9631865.1 nicotinate-nucleotide adenylyltransferase [Blastopirellula sediminis]